MIPENAKLQLETGTPMRKVAKSLRISEPTLKQYMAKQGIKTPFMRQAEIRRELETDAHLIEELAKDMTTVELAEKWGVTREIMWRFLHLHDIPYKPAKVSAHPESLRRKCLNIIKSGGTITEAAKAGGIRYETVRNWVLRHG